MTVKARELEMKFTRDRGIYTKVQRSEAAANGCKVISTKWLDVNKSDDVNPNIRYRMIARDAALEALRMTCSICASHSAASTAGTSA